MIEEETNVVVVGGGGARHLTTLPKGSSPFFVKCYPGVAHCVQGLFLPPYMCVSGKGVEVESLQPSAMTRRSNEKSTSD